ncbi:hypothetical protein PHLGIDRAFT_410260 [Phlebiopsis gigantea 11061_1 CR5-6]|uniref:Uncharacterized protein n=1 Tax=Phlebiopsis gigantea (strain 11061_1 CR5-6) TaxID=745531 RepID=A0A0C3SB82_PHLG1|nr:hypothetical protein PHLGIDRAFT_410260 [Phlebiopsis gigantea 11061_1 CR5-6]
MSPIARPSNIVLLVTHTPLLAVSHGEQRASFTHAVVHRVHFSRRPSHSYVTTHVCSSVIFSSALFSAAAPPRSPDFCARRLSSASGPLLSILCDTDQEAIWYPARYNRFCALIAAQYRPPSHPARTYLRRLLVYPHRHHDSYLSNAHSATDPVFPRKLISGARHTSSCLAFTSTHGPEA